MQRVSIGQSREETMLVDPSQVPPFSRSLGAQATVLSSIILRKMLQLRDRVARRGYQKSGEDGLEGQVSLG